MGERGVILLRDRGRGWGVLGHEARKGFRTLSELLRFSEKLSKSLDLNLH